MRPVTLLFLLSILYPAPGLAAPAAGDNDLPPEHEPLTARTRVVPQGEVTARYAYSLKFFNRRLTNTQARALAGAAIGESRKDGLDARLVIAALVAEGTLARVRSAGGKVFAGKVPARAAVAELAADLGHHLRPAAGANRVTAAAVRKALAQRGARLYHGAAKASGYAQRVWSLYQQLSGAGVQ